MRFRVLAITRVLADERVRVRVGERAPGYVWELRRVRVRVRVRRRNEEREPERVTGRPR